MDDKIQDQPTTLAVTYFTLLNTSQRSFQTVGGRGSISRSHLFQSRLLHGDVSMTVGHSHLTFKERKPSEHDVLNDTYNSKRLPIATTETGTK